jgi:hypothetical protein
VKIKKVVYNPATRTVTLTPRGSLNNHRRYTLTVNGVAPGGLADLQGRLLDGKGDGQPGSDFRALILGRQVVPEDVALSVPLGQARPRQGRPAVHPQESPQIHPSRAPFSHAQPGR